MFIIISIYSTGIFSHHVYRCFVGSQLGVFISCNPDFRLPSSDDVDILMIGPGTGIAPFMSFISERGNQFTTIIMFFLVCINASLNMFMLIG